MPGTLDEAVDDMPFFLKSALQSRELRTLELYNYCSRPVNDCDLEMDLLGRGEADTTFEALRDHRLYLVLPAGSPRSPLGKC